ncbi:MAG: hypothetical protein ABGW78_15915 [Pirellulales bacterium]
MNKNTLNEAIDLVLAGDWERGHDIVQQDESDAVACWIHAVIHKIEGDFGNAGYWYRKSGRLADMERETSDELLEIKQFLEQKS